MRQYFPAWTAIIALSLGLLTGSATASFADTVLYARQKAPRPDQSQVKSYDPTSNGASNVGPYDNPEFVVPESQIHS